MPSGGEYIILFVLALPFIIGGLVAWRMTRKHNRRRAEAAEALAQPPTPPTPGEAE